MTTDSPLNIQSLNKYRATMKKEEVAEALGIARHIIAPLSRAGLIKPLGHPQKYCVKLYSRDLLARTWRMWIGSTRWWPPFTSIGALKMPASGQSWQN